MSDYSIETERVIDRLNVLMAINIYCASIQMPKSIVYDGMSLDWQTYELN